jgi:hypothetical protein
MSKASYSTWLLLALKVNLNDCSMRTPSGPSNTTSAPLPLILDAPSTESVQGCSLFSSGGVVSSNKKSTSICDLIAPDDRNFCSILGRIISSKMTKIGPNTK